jgi:bifunctional DNase/RNase
MNKVPLNVLGISYSQTQTGAYALVLGEENGNRRIPIIIGGFEAQAIAIQLEGLKPPRPLTHDLFYNFAIEYGVVVESVHIFRLEEGIFYSKLVCTNGGKRVELDARTSDAIALALRFQCPIYTIAEIMERAGIVFSNEPQPQGGQPTPVRGAAKKKDNLQYMDIPELENMLNLAIMNENYEQASEIRDEIKRRKRD